MFSFIGCGGCEYAIKEMRKKHYAFAKGFDFYYSSPYNNSESLKKYLNKKEFPFQAFPKDSEMEQAFSIFSYPTFVLVDENGNVEKVMRSYSKEVEAILFENREH